VGCVVKRRRLIGFVGGAAAALSLRPFAALAQQAGKTYRIGYLALLPGEDKTWAKTLVQRLQELGYREGSNLILDYRSAEGRVERLPQLAAELVDTHPDVLITGFGTLAPKAAIAANSSASPTSVICSNCRRSVRRSATPSCWCWSAMR